MLIKSSVALLFLSMAGAGSIGTATGVAAHKPANRVSSERLDNNTDKFGQSTVAKRVVKTASAKFATGH